MPWAPINGTELYYESHGEGPALVFAHGAGGNHLSWWQQVPVFAQRFRCITFDHRAFGRSLDGDGAGRRAFGQDLIELLDHLEIESASIVAQSMGGRTAVGFAVRAPERLRAIVFAGTTGGCVNDEIRERQRAQRVVRRKLGGLTGASLGQSTRRKRPHLTFLYESIRALNPPRPRDFLAPPPPSYRGSAAEALTRLGKPVMFIVGEEDAVTPPDVVRMAHELVPGSRYVVVQDAGHSAYFERAEEFNRHLLDFFAEVDAV